MHGKSLVFDMYSDRYVLWRCQTGIGKLPRSLDASLHIMKHGLFVRLCSVRIAASQFSTPIAPCILAFLTPGDAWAFAYIKSDDSRGTVSHRLLFNYRMSDRCFKAGPWGEHSCNDGPTNFQDMPFKDLESGGIAVGRANRTRKRLFGLIGGLPGKDLRDYPLLELGDGA